MSAPIYERDASLALYFFNQISRYPRQSKKEGKVRAFIRRWSELHRYHYTADQCGNCIVRVPASAGREKRPALALQAHLDMVGEKNPGYTHDFAKDPIVPRYRDGWVSAPQTTLGADNGIGIALALALVEDPLVSHPELELVFTVDEETGLSGAAGLQPNAIHAAHLLNLDSEDDEVLITGCAGGQNILFKKRARYLSAKAGAHHRRPASYAMTLTGFHGGHSGVDIGKGFGNALSAGASILRTLFGTSSAERYLGALQGGTVHNAIPRECRAELLFADSDAYHDARALLEKALTEYAADQKLPRAELALSFEEIAPPAALHTAESARELLEFIIALPHGVRSYTADPAIPQTSSNIATIEQSGGADAILVSLRSSMSSDLQSFSDELSALAKAHGVEVHASGEYPAWQPQPHSALLEKCRQAYADATGAPPRVEIIHAGLEPAVIGKIFPTLDMVSCGPLILNPHSPQERLSIMSTAKIYRMLVALLGSW